LKSIKPKIVTTASTRPNAKGLVIQEQEQASTPITSSKEKGKGIMVEKPLKMKKKDQDKVETDYELAQRLQAEEQEELTIEEKSKLFQQLLEKGIKHFAAKRAKERRNRPPIKAQQRSIMYTYLKNMARWKPKDLKTNLKRVGDELEQEKANKQKIDDDQEEAEKKELMEIVPDEEEVAVDAIPLATKPPSIVDWKIVKEGKISFFQIIRASGSSKRYSSFIQMLRDFDREDLETLWKLVKAKHGYTRPEEGYDRVLWGDLKTMFEPNVEDLLVLLVQKLLLLLLKVNAAGIKVTTAKRLQLLKG
ncbi:hypothetical protein Tco_0455513, partial [Tanacetum coccineum]